MIIRRLATGTRKTWKDEAEEAESYWVKNVHNPSLTAYLPDPEKATGAAVVICPGGGHRLLVFNAELIFPVPLIDVGSGVRLSAFFDVGNVFGDYNTFEASGLKYSVGLAGLWLSPLGPISVSLGYPLNADDIDEVQNFQFTVGTFF